MIDKNIYIFFLRNEELEAEQEKVGKRQLDMITDEFSMEVSSPELGFWFGNCKVMFAIKVFFFFSILPNKDEDDEAERDWKAEAKEANRRLQEERNEVRDV